MSFTWHAPCQLASFYLVRLLIICDAGLASAISSAVLVLMPLVNAAGVDPIYFGVLFLINNVIGLITPPVGVVLNTVAGVGKVSMDAEMRGVIPAMIAQFVLMFVVAMVLSLKPVAKPVRRVY